MEDAQKNSEAQIPLRTREAINDEYSRLAAKAGDCEYKIKYLQAELKHTYDKMHQVNQEKAAPQPASDAVINKVAEEVKNSPGFEEHA